MQKPYLRENVVGGKIELMAVLALIMLIALFYGFFRISQPMLKGAAQFFGFGGHGNAYDNPPTKRVNMGVVNGVGIEVMQATYTIEVTRAVVIIKGGVGGVGVVVDTPGTIVTETPKPSMTLPPTSVVITGYTPYVGTYTIVPYDDRYITRQVTAWQWITKTPTPGK